MKSITSDRAFALLKSFLNGQSGELKQIKNYRNILYNSKLVNKILHSNSFFKFAFDTKIGKFLTAFFRKGENQDLYTVSALEKSYSIDFITYILKNNPLIPFNLFNSSDRQILESFIQNKFITAFFEKVNKSRLFSLNDLKRQRNYQVFSQKNKARLKKGNWIYCEFNSVLNHFEQGIFIEKYGLNLIKNRSKLRNSIIVDAGAFIGDSTFILNRELNPKKIIAIEPDLNNFRKLLINLKLNNMINVDSLKIAVGERREKKSIVRSGTSSAYLIEGKYQKGEIDVTTIDNIISQMKINQVGLIKLDIEGYELAAIKGAKKTIKKYKPVLLISLYHKGQDFFEIPSLIKKWVPSYTFSFVNLNSESATFEKVLLAQ